MAITATDIEYRLSGGAANADPIASLGGAKSSVAVTGSTLWDTVTGDESTAGSVEYRCLYVHNAHATLTLTAAKVWLQANTASDDTQLAIGLGTSAVGGDEQSVADEATAPAGVTFSEPANKAAGLAIGDLAPGQSKAVWLRRTVNAGAAASNDTATIRVAGDTTA